METFVERKIEGFTGLILFTIPSTQSRPEQGAGPGAYVRPHPCSDAMCPRPEEAAAAICSSGRGGGGSEQLDANLEAVMQSCCARSTQLCVALRSVGPRAVVLIRPA